MVNPGWPSENQAKAGFWIFATTIAVAAIFMWVMGGRLDKKGGKK